MKRCLFTLFFVLFTQFLSVNLYSNEKLMELGISAKEHNTMAEISKTLTSLQATSVWPRYDIANTPTMFTFNNGHVYAFHLENQFIWDKINIGKLVFDFIPNDPYSLKNVPMQPNFELGKQNIFIISLDQFCDSTLLQQTTFVHERFHRYQQEQFQNGIKAQGDYHDHLNSDNLTLMIIEEKILAEFLSFRGSSENTNRIRKDLILDFMSVNYLRKKLLNSSSVKWEEFQQKIEGLADYVSLKVLDNISSNDDGGIDYLQWQLENYANDDNVAERAIKWRHYGIGASIGYVLDFLDIKNWKHLVENGLGQISVLENNLKLTNNEIQIRFAAIKQKYKYEQLKNSSHGLAQEHKKLIEDLKKEYASLAGISLVLATPSMSVTGGGSNTQLLYLPDASTLSVDDNSLTATNDNSWILELNNPRILFQNNAGHREFKIEKDLKITIDGKIFNLEQLIKLQQPLTFTKISWKGDISSFLSTGHKGLIKFEKEKIHITFDD